MSDWARHYGVRPPDADPLGQPKFYTAQWHRKDVISLYQSFAWQRQTFWLTVDLRLNSRYAKPVPLVCSRPCVLSTLLLAAKRGVRIILNTVLAPSTARRATPSFHEFNVLNRIVMRISWRWPLLSSKIYQGIENIVLQYEDA